MTSSLLDSDLDIEPNALFSSFNGLNLTQSNKKPAACLASEFTL